MIEPRIILCSGTKLSDLDFGVEGSRVLELDCIGSNPSVNLKINNAADVFYKELPPRLVDMLEIAAYVYSADCATNRGSGWYDHKSTESWSRKFHFAIPVRDEKFWNQDDVKRSLSEILSFISDDRFEFDFLPLTQDRPIQRYLEYCDDKDWAFYTPERVLMFSGGLDSLAGAVEMLSSGKNVVLVSHRSIGIISSRQKKLVEELKKKYPRKILHIPVWVNKSPASREETQRTRSFLFASLGAIIANSVNSTGVRFFENGVVSLNLPISDEILRARASRTTHPYSLDLMSRFFSLVIERDLKIDNPFLFLTKSEVVKCISDNNGNELIGHSCSCAHSSFKGSKNQWHCGTCSQCIDRRIAVVSQHLEKFDPDTDYRTDVFTGERKKQEERNIAIAYARHALDLSRMSSLEIAEKFGMELSRAAYPFSNTTETVERLIEMHVRHGMTVRDVLTEQLRLNANKLYAGELSEDSMLGLISEREHTRSTWIQFSDRIVELLSIGIPISCVTHKPLNEPHLQQLCDGILKANELDLIREFPSLRWSSKSTKPDWSMEELLLWVEAKYVKISRDISRAAESIAADITQYTDNRRNVLFVVYDPYHKIINRQEFSEPISRRSPLMNIAFIS